MFYIRDIDSKKYIKITKENEKLKFSLTSSQMLAYKFRDSQIRTIYKRVINLFPDKVFLADYVSDEKEKKNSFKTSLSLMLPFIYSLMVTVFFGFLYLHNTQKLEQDTIKLKNDFSTLRNDYINMVSIIDDSKLKEAKNTEMDINAAIDYFNSRSIYNFALKASIKYDVPLYIIYAVIDTESEGFENAKSKAGCIGLTQISKDAVKEYNRVHSTNYELSDAWNIDLNIEIGIWYYRWCINQVLETKLLDDDIYNSAYIMYNIGYGNYVNIKNTSSIIKENKAYIGGTLCNYKALVRFERKRELCEDVLNFKGL